MSGEARILRGSGLTPVAAARMVLAEAVRTRAYQDCPLGLVVARYLDWKLDERGAAKITVSDYEYQLARLCLDHPTLELASFEPPEGRELVRAYIARHWGSGAPAYARTSSAKGQRSPATKNKVRAILSDFFKWCVTEDLMRGSPIIGIARTKGKGVERKVYQLGEPERILAACTTDRDRCAVALTNIFGLRKMEVRLLRLRDYDMGRGTLTVHGKGSKIRVLPVAEHPQLAALLNAHWIERLFHGDADEYLLYPQKYGRRNDPDGPRIALNWEDRHAPLTDTPMHHWWKQRLADAGVPHSRKMHEMRHTALTTLLQATGNMKVVQLTAGHESMATTADIYSHYDLDDLRAAHSTLSAYLAERADA